MAGVGAAVFGGLADLTAETFATTAFFFVFRFFFRTDEAISFIANISCVDSSAARPLPAETHTVQSGPDEPPYRLHLRLLKDGAGVLIVNAATVLHLNATAAEFAYHMMKGTSPEETARQVSDRYHISLAAAQEDYVDFRDRIQTMIHTPDLDPTTYLDFERVAPHSQDLTAPLRLDCALTYRLPERTSAEYAPVKRVDRELTTAEWQTIIDNAWLAGIPHITFTGGEPTLRDDLPTLIAHAEKNGQVCGLLSDGMKLADKDYLHTLLQTGLDHLLFLLCLVIPLRGWRQILSVITVFTIAHSFTLLGSTASPVIRGATLSTRRCGSWVCVVCVSTTTSSNW